MKLQSAEQLTLGQQVVQQLEGDCSRCRAQPAGMLLGGGRSLLLFLHLVNRGTSQASCWPCSAFKLSSKCVNHKMLMLDSTCKSVLGFVSRESASGKLKSPSRVSVPCRSIPLFDLWGFLPLWSLYLESFEKVERFCWEWQNWPRCT